MHAVSGDAELLDAATRGVEWTVRRQRPDGSWPYGERPNLSWIDGFHTGYVLDSLIQCAAAGIERAGEAFERGLDFYREALFLADGTPKYSAGSVYPIDMQCVAQGIQTLALASEYDPTCLQQAWEVLDWACAHMRLENGFFAFQRRRLWINRATHMRGVVAPMVLALTHLLKASAPPVAPAHILADSQGTEMERR
jgi:polysaccharide biosynthesis protein VpsJ